MLPREAPEANMENPLVCDPMIEIPDWPSKPISPRFCPVETFPFDDILKITALLENSEVDDIAITIELFPANFISFNLSLKFDPNNWLLNTLKFVSNLQTRIPSSEPPFVLISPPT